MSDQGLSAARANAMHHVNVGPNIRRLRNLYDIKQEQFAKQLGISRQMLHCYENNKYPIPQAVFSVVLAFFKISVEEIQLSTIALLLKNVHPIHIIEK